MVTICARIVKAAVEKTAYHFDRLFDYMLPHGLDSAVQSGCRVLVPFGTANSHLILENALVALINRLTARKRNGAQAVRAKANNR